VFLTSRLFGCFFCCIRLGAWFETDDVVLCHALIAMAKQMAISKEARALALHNASRNNRNKTPDGTPTVIFASKLMVKKAAEKAEIFEKRRRSSRGVDGEREEGKSKLGEDESFDLQMNTERQRMLENLALEGMVFLSLLGEAKKHFLFPESKDTNQGQFVRKLLQLCASKPNRAARFGGIQILASFMRSSVDKEREYNEELSKLRKLASKGLGPDQAAEMAKLAGDPSLIQKCTRLLVSEGAVRALVEAANAFKAERGKDFKNESSNASKNKEPAPTNGRNDAGQSRSELDRKTTGGMNERMIEAMAFCFKKIAQDEKNRGPLVQQRGLRLLGELYGMGAEVMDRNGGPDSKKGMWREDCAVALARVAISTNPALYPTGSMYTFVRPLIWLFGGASHELHQFEAGLGLTNIASVDAETRDVLVLNGAWSACVELLSSENEEVQRVGIECMANLIICDKSLERLSSSDQDIKLFLLFAKADNKRMQLAATGGLAMMTQDPRVAENVLRLEGEKVLKEIKAGTDDQNVLVRVNAALKNLKETVATNLKKSPSN